MGEKEQRQRIKKLRWNHGPDREAIKMKKNEEIRRKWKIPTSQSLLRREEWLGHVKGKETQLIAYNTKKDIAEERIKILKEKLKKLKKKKTEAYDGKAGYEEARPPEREEIEKVKRKIEKAKKESNEKPKKTEPSLGPPTSEKEEKEREKNRKRKREKEEIEDTEIRKRRKEWNELAMIWEERQERMEKNKRKRTEEEIEKANKRVTKIPLRHKLRDQLIERLQNTNIKEQTRKT